MISHRDLRIALRQPFIDATLTQFDNNVAWEGHTFDPANKALWLQERLLPASDQASSDTNEGSIGIYQLSVYVPNAQGIGTDGNRAIAETQSAIVSNVYNPNTVLIAIAGGSIVIDVTDALPVQVDLKNPEWQSIPISIVYRAFKVNS